MTEERHEVDRSSSDGVVASMADLLARRQRWRRDGTVLVWTNGCFDILHVGHVHLLEQAKRLGDVLIVGVNSDDAVRELKGPNRPIFPVADRLRILAALKAPDFVTTFEGLTPEVTLADLQPDVHVKGGDYAPPLGLPMPEKEIVESYGGRVEFVDLLEGHSTSRVLDVIADRIHSEG